MKKLNGIRLAILCFATGALLVIGSNLFSQNDTINPGFDNGKTIKTTPLGNYCCCDSSKAYCSPTIYDCTTEFCSKENERYGD